MLSRSQRSDAPPVSWLLAMMYEFGANPGIEAIECSTSVFLKLTGAETHALVEIAK